MQSPSPSKDPTVKPEVRSLRLFTICLLFAGFLLAGSWWAWPHPPAGPSDGYPGRGFLLLAPAMVALFSLAALPQPESFRKRWRFSSRGLLPAWLAFFLLYAAGFHALLILAAVGRPVHATAQWILGPWGLFYIMMGNNLSKCRDEFFYRIRTPWTIRSELSWNRTHRFGAWMYVIEGLSICVCALAGISALWLAILVGSAGLGGVALLWGYSYVLWRRDPERTTFQRSKRSVLAERKDFALKRLVSLGVQGVAIIWIGTHNFGAQGADWRSVLLGIFILSYGVSQFYTAKKGVEWELPRSIILTFLGLAVIWFGSCNLRPHGANWAVVFPLFVVLGVVLSGNGISQFYTATKWRTKRHAQHG